MAPAAKVFRAAFDARLPWLAGLHTPQEDRDFWQGPVFDRCEIWGAEQNLDLLGVIAFRDCWIEQLYVLPDYQGKGIGARLLECAKLAHSELRLWTFQRNAGARRFYEAHGFCMLAETGGRDNEEREPDMLYHWHR